MAEQEAHQKPLLETAKGVLDQAQKQRKNAETDLQGAEDGLKETQQKLARLQANEQRLQKQYAAHAAELRDLPHRIHTTQQTLENLQAKQQQRQNQEAQNPGALARLIRTPVRKPARLTRRIQATQQNLENLRDRRQQLQEQQPKDAAELERLKPQIEEGERTVGEQKGEVEKFRGKLNVAESDVIKKSSEVNKEASKEIMGLAWQLVPRSLISGASTGYSSVLATNLAYSQAFYSAFGINIFKYLQFQDFATPRAESLISLNVLVWILLIYIVLRYLSRHKSPLFVEKLAGWLFCIAKLLERPFGKIVFVSSLFIPSFIVIPGAVAKWKAESLLTSNQIVHVVTVREHKLLNDLVHIGSSSTHAFFYDSRNTANTVALPLSGIVCISDDKSYCEPNEATPAPVVEATPAPVVIVYEPPPQDQPCEDCIPPALTEGMQFYLVHQERGSLEAPRGIEISGINERWLRAFKPAVEACSEPGKLAKLRIEGFASSEPPRHLPSSEADTYNCKVANRRAEKAIDFLIGKNQEYGTSEAECQEECLFSFGKKQGLDFEIEYRPWQTFQTMEKSRPVIDELEGTVIPERALLNRSVRLTIVDAGGCKPPPSTPPNANEAP